MDKLLLFEYGCPECGLGTVRTTRVQNYKTKIKGYPFIVDEAFIGVCDHCEAEHFASEETKRWDELFYHSLEQRQAFLSPQEITELRKILGLSMEDFARLIGCTRQSIYNWEKQDRTSPPSRAADLLMKLVRRSIQVGPVDIVTFLLDEARKWGIVIEVRRSTVPSEDQHETLTLLTRRIPKKGLPEPTGEYALAAETTSPEEEQVAVETPEGKKVGVLDYDYEHAALFIETIGDFPPWKILNVEFETSDGRHFFEFNISVLNGRFVLSEKTQVRPREVSKIMLKPYYEGPEV
jgi:putative zinc finger/helix-turn-helix YgiT family protein